MGFLSFVGFLTQDFSPDPQNQEDLVEKVDEVPHAEASLVVGADTSVTPLGGAPPQVDKIKLAQEHVGLVQKLLAVSSQ